MTKLYAAYRLAFILLILTLSSSLKAQINLGNNTIAVENFNSLGTSATAALPANWKVSGAGLGLSSGWTTGTNSTSTTQAANSGAPVNGGIYNWGTTPGVDRAIGFMSSGSYASPNSVMAYYRNTTGSAVTSISVSFQIERYRINTDPFILSFFSSTNGSSWTSQPDGDLTSTAFPTGSSGYTFTEPRAIVRTLTITGINIPNNGDIYLRWVFTTGTNSQGLGLDEVKVFAGAATPIMSATLEDKISVDNGVINQANAGDELRYTTKIKNSGTGDAGNVQINIPAPSNTTLVAGSVKTSALARDDNFTTGVNTQITSSNVLANDYGLPSVNVVSFGPTSNVAAAVAGGSSTSDNGGTITINANGSFVYEPALGFTGIDRFSYIATTGVTGLPNSEATVFVSVGTAATATADNYPNIIGNVSISRTAANGLLSNDAGSNVLIIAVNGSAANIATPITTANGGNLTVNADGSFTYNPAPGYEGSDNFTYTIDNGFSSPSTVTVSLSVAGMIWFIDNNYTGSISDGRLGSPFKTLSAFQFVNNGSGNNPASGDNIFIYESATAYSGSVILLNNQKLIGQDASGSLSTITGLTPPSYSAALPVTNSGNGVFVSISNAGTIVTLSTGGGNTVQGMTFNPSAGSALSTGASSAGVNTAIELIINASATANGVTIANASGSFNYQSGSITSTASGSAFDVSGGSPTVTVSINITQNGIGRLINIASISANTITFNTGTLTANNPSTGVNLSSVNGNLTFANLNLGTVANRLTNGAVTITGGAGIYNLGSVSIFTTGATGINAINADGTISSTSGTVDATNGTALNISGPAGLTNLGLTLTTVNSSGGINNVSFVSCSGTATLGTGAFGGASGTSFNIGSVAAGSGSTCSVTYNGSITKTTAGRVVEIQNKTAGTVSLGGAISGTGSSTGINLATNPGATINFTGVITLNTAASTAFSATGGGTISSTATTSTIVTTTGIGLNVANTTIGSGNITFRSIASNGSSSGIVLNTTGTSGGLIVTGDGGATSNSSGGTIQNTTGAGISLTNTTGVSFNYMNIQNGGDDGIAGSNVTGFTLTRSLVSNNGNAVGEAGLDFDNLHGTSSITNTTITLSHENNIEVRNSVNNGAQATLTISNCTISNASSKTQSDDGVLYQGIGTANMSITVSNCTLTANRGDHLQATVNDNGIMNAVFQNNTLSGGHSTALGQDIVVNTGIVNSGATFTYDINGNTINGAILTAITATLGTPSTGVTMSGRIRNNIIGTAGVIRSGSEQANGISINATGNGIHTASITGNTIRQHKDRGISASASDGSGFLNLTVQSNTVLEGSPINPPGFPADGTGGREAFLVTAGATATDAHTVCLQLGEISAALKNNFNRGPEAVTSGLADVRVRKRFNATVRLPGYAGGLTDAAAVGAYFAARNTSSEDGTLTDGSSASGTGGFTGGAACNLP